MASETKKHTPGPWSYHSETLRGGTFWCVMRDEPNGPLESIDIHESDNGEADARLIAAAPDMLVALKWLCEQMQAEQDAGVSGFEDWMTPARAAIAKATS